MKMDPVVPAIVKPVEDLASLARIANEQHEEGEAATRKGLKHFCLAGEALIKAKALCGRGKWLAWLKENVGYSRMTASRYMRFAECNVNLQSPLEDQEEVWRRISGNVRAWVEDDPEPEEDVPDEGALDPPEDLGAEDGDEVHVLAFPEPAGSKRAKKKASTRATEKADMVRELRRVNMALRILNDTMPDPARFRQVLGHSASAGMADSLVSTANAMLQLAERFAEM